MTRVRARTRAARVVVEPRAVPRADLAIRGTLHSVDQYLNVKLLNVSIDDTENFPHMVRSPPSLATLPPSTHPPVRERAPVARRSNPSRIASCGAP